MEARAADGLSLANNGFCLSWLELDDRTRLFEMSTGLSHLDPCQGGSRESVHSYSFNHPRQYLAKLDESFGWETIVAWPPSR